MQGRTLHVVHVHPAAFAFDLGKGGDHHPREPRHALLVEPGLVLGLGGLHAQQLRLSLTHLRYAGYFLGEFARAAVFGEQGRQHALWVCIGECDFQLAALGAEAGLRRATQGLGGEP